ncbi:MAG: Periplasmic serine endoprotease DegP [Anaerolineales bacterium]|nr:Periplasmic serine endoprotease DegP [Anaerolineales bacterium]
MKFIRLLSGPREVLSCCRRSPDRDVGGIGRETSPSFIKVLIWGYLVVSASLFLLSCQTATLETPSSGAPATATVTVRQAADPTQSDSRRQAQEGGRLAAATPTPIIIRTDAEAVEQLLINVYERVSPAVVHIDATTERAQSPTGSGFVLDMSGRIVTNNHVIADAEQIDVSFADGTRAEAEVLGADPAIDLAVIQVNVPAEVLVPAELGNSDTLRAGQRAIAIGNPFGQFDQSMTAGIISALGRVLDPTDEGEFIPKLIQTDAAINPGNSGGPLLDSGGRVIGVNTLIFSETGTSTGVGFAVPVNTLRRSLPALLEGRQVGQPWLGIAGPPELDATLVEELGLPASTGAYVSYVFPGGPAEEAGLIGGSTTADGSLKPGGDLIIAVDSVPVESFDGLLRYFSDEMRVGQMVKLTVRRGEQTRVVPVTLGERPDS